MYTFRISPTSLTSNNIRDAAFSLFQEQRDQCGLRSQRPKLQYRYLGRKARSTFRYGEAAMEGLLQRVIYSPETKEQKKKHQKMQLSSLKKRDHFSVYQEKRSLNKVLTHLSI